MRFVKEVVLLVVSARKCRWWWYEGKRGSELGRLSAGVFIPTQAWLTGATEGPHRKGHADCVGKLRAINNRDALIASVTTVTLT